jgi:anaerobic ribonucleoside-triphosphate reductase
MTRDDLDESERTRVEQWTRVMGYHRPVSAWNPGKQQEHKDRKYFSERKAQDHA